MFKKIVSSLPFSTTYVSQLGPFAKALKKEDVIRKITLTFMLLTLIVQLLIILQPAQTTESSAKYTAPTQQYNVSAGVSEFMTATNITQGFVDASSIVAKPNDLISYTVSISNISDESQPLKLSYSLGDAMNYAILYDNGGGSLDSISNLLSWQETTIGAKSTQSRTFVLKVNSNLPATAQSKNQTNLYDCVIGEISSNSPIVQIECPSIKLIERISSELPNINSIDSIIATLSLVALSLYFHERTRQLKKEIRLIRQDSNTGAI